MAFGHQNHHRRRRIKSNVGHIWQQRLVRILQPDLFLAISPSREPREKNVSIYDLFPFLKQHTAISHETQNFSAGKV